jgi:solute carrier family 35 protein F5
VTYANSVFFVIPLPPILLWIAIKDPAQFAELRNLLRIPVQQYSLLPDGEDSDSSIKPDEPSNDPMSRSGSPSNPVGVDDTVTFAQNFGGSMTKEKFSLLETAKLSFLFCFLWFPANYFAAACLEYTTVGSATILAATSSIWTLLIGTLFAVERFTIRKLVGVLASLAGIILIYSMDMSGDTDKNRGTFPHKTSGEIAIGDILAFISAVVYGIYAVMIKKRIGDENRVNMPLFFGLVGLMTVLLLWPVFIILHLTGIETFELPPDRRVTLIILLNSTTSLVSDFCWAYAMLYTSPLLVTVGLSLTIPLSLIGQMVLDHQYSSPLYWIGACVVLLSFIFINHEESKEEEATQVEPGDRDDVSFGGS